ncbi:MAG: hypothetical protein K2Q33_08205, partial [Gammaproteobacteria bacterium]|nr:hypothetical protein [Gammaproteobacteria bacterium]
YRTFQYHISKRVGSLQERYYLDLESLLEGIKENSKKLYQQPVLRFSRDEMRMYNVKEDESSFREARERIAIDPVAIAQRNRDIGIAVQYLEDSMGGNYSGSKVYDYEPTQKVKDLLALINPLMVHYNKKKPKDLFPAYNQGNPDEASLLTVRTHLQPALEGVAEIRADLMQCEGALKTKRHINFLKNNAMEIVAKYQGSSDATEMVAELFGIEDRILSSLEVSENDPENIKELKRNTLAYELEWMKALKINVLKIRANYIRENYTGGNLGIASNELNRLEADLVRLGILESELKELRQIKVAVLREEGYYIVQRYRMNEISSQEMLTGLMVIEEQLIPLRENPSNQDEFQALRATLEEGKHLVNLIPPGNIMGILNAIGEAKYGNAREQLLAQLTILREEISAREEAEAISRQRQIASNSSSSSSSSGPSPSLSSGSAPSPNSSSLASSALSSSALSSKSRVTQRVDMKKGGVPSQASSLDLEHTESSQDSSATREIDANYLRQQFITNYKRIKMSASFSPFRSSERNYEGSRIEQIMDEVLMKPLTPYKKESTDSAKALRQALGCSKEDFLEVGKLYALFKAANGRDLSSTECFRTFVEWVQQEERIPSSPGVCQRVLGPFIEAQADLQQGSAPKVGKH